MGNNKRARRQRAISAREQGLTAPPQASAGTITPAAGSAVAISPTPSTAVSSPVSRTPASTTTNPSPTPLDEEEIQYRARYNQYLFDMLVTARQCHLRGELGEARERYEDLLPVSETIRGRDNPVTIRIVNSLCKIYSAQGDREAILRIVAARIVGEMFGP